MNSLHNKTIPAARFSNLLFLFVFLLFLPAAGSGETEKSGVAPQVLSLPSGPGSIEGLGESFEPDLNTGTSTYGVKIAVSPGVAGFEPQIRLVYNSGYGNSPVGLGWDLNLEYIQRQTDKGLPAYADSDTFIHSAGGELVPLPDGVFRQKIEGSFTKFKRTDEGWEAWRRNGTRLFFGTAVESRQTHAGLGIFAWYLEKEIDPNGNEIRYQYATDQGKVYLQEIRYSIMADTVCKSVRFLYEDRPDIATSYVSRAKVVTARRLKTIEVLSEDNLVRSYQLTYAADSGFSLLAAVTQYGSDNITALPPLHFSYSSYRPDNHQTVIMTNTPPAGVSLTNANVDLVDINGDALPDLIHTDSTLGRHDFYINEGNGSWNPTPTTPDNSPPSLLMQDGVMMADMNGDGNSDLFVKNSSQFGYFKNTRTLKWEEADWSDCTPNPGFSFESQTVKLLDVNNDKLIDVLIDSGSSYRVWLNRTNNQWSEQFDFETFLPDGHLSLTSPFVKMGDMNGDRIQDLVYVLDGYIAYFPGMGNGQFDSEVEMVAPPANLGSNAAKLATADIDSNGLDDLVLVGNENVMVWFNGGNGGFLAPVTFTGTPPFQEPATYRFADMNGDGLVDLLLTNENSVERFVYVDFTRGTHPNLLTGIDNGLGMRTTIAYKASTVDYLNDRAAGSPWTETLPFPVQVVASVAIEDGNSGQQYRSEYRYRDGYYDGVEKEFRGFGSVRKLEMGEATAPSLLSLFQFDTGKTEESRKGLVTLAATLTGNGSLEETASLFDRQDNTVHTTHLVTGLNGENVRFSYLDSTTTRIFEQSGQPLTLYHVFEQDEYGNTVKDFNYGRVNGSDYGVGDDEVLTTTSYAIDEEAWMVDRPATINITDLQGRFAALQQNTYDARGNLVREDHSPDGSAFIPLVRREYDSHGNVITTTDANDHCRQVTYDSRFHTLPVTESICGLGLEMTADYDHGLGVLTDYTDFNHQVTNFAYDPLGRLTAIVKPGDSALYPTQVFAYSLANPVSSILTRTREQSGAPGTYDTVAYFDGLGRKLQTRSEGEGGDWVVTEAVAFNQRREVAARWLPYSDGTADFASPAVDLPKESLAYDAKKRVTRRTNADATYQTTAYTPLARIEQDEEDNTVGGVHAGTPHTFYSDGLERLVRVEERNSATVFTTRYGYDARGNLVRVEDNEGNVKTMTYDGLGRKIAMDDPDKHQMHYVYDPAGNLTATTDAKGQTVAYTYDAANRMLTETFGAVRVRYHYDNDLAADHPAMANTRGRLAWVEDEAGREFFSYDPRGNVTTKVREAGGSTFTSVMAWDAMNRLTSLTYPDGTVVTYHYNNRNLLEQIPGYVDAIEYNPAGRKTRLVYANGLESTYHYDQRQRMTDLQSTRQTSVLQKLAYQYDGASNILAITDGRTTPTPESLSRTFRYDDLYRLTEASAPDWMESYQYSSIGNMTFKSDVGVMTYGAGTAGPHAVTGAAGAGLTYTYDLNGNLATKRPGFSYQFDHRDRLARVEREADQAAVTFAYDYQGNRKTKTVTRGAEMTRTIYVDQYSEVRGSELIKQVFADDRLVARVVTPNGAEAAELRANPLSAADFDTHPADGVISLEEIRRQGENDSAMEPEEAADALRLYYAHLGETPTMLPFATMAAVLRELGTPVAVNTGTVFFYLPDHLGSPAVVTDRNGDMVEESVWYPYGTERKRTGTVASPYRFTGKELDDETGLHYFGARYYDAQVGRFVSVDPLFVENSNNKSMLYNIKLNFYMYAENSPVSYKDTDGLDAEHAEEYAVYVLNKSSGSGFWQYTAGHSAIVLQKNNTYIYRSKGSSWGKSPVGGTFIEGRDRKYDSSDINKVKEKINEDYSKKNKQGYDGITQKKIINESQYNQIKDYLDSEERDKEIYSLIMFDRNCKDYVESALNEAGLGVPHHTYPNNYYVDIVENGLNELPQGPAAFTSDITVDADGNYCEICD